MFERYEKEFDFGPDRRKLCFVDFADKAERKKGLTSVQGSKFAAICGLGEHQLIECYKDFGHALTPEDCARACEMCPNARNVRSFVNERYLNLRFDKFNPEVVERMLEPFDEPDAKPGRYVYFIADGAAVKIGVALKPLSRLSELQVGNPRELSLLYLIPFKDREAAHEAEQKLHQLYYEYRIQGEWFAIRDKLSMYWNAYFDPKYCLED